MAEESCHPSVVGIKSTSSRTQRKFYHLKLPSAFFNVVIHIFFHAGKAKVETAEPLLCVFSLHTSASFCYLWFSFAEPFPISTDTFRNFSPNCVPFLLGTEQHCISQPSLQLGVVMWLSPGQWNVDKIDTSLLGLSKPIYAPLCSLPPSGCQWMALSPSGMVEPWMEDVWVAEWLCGEGWPPPSPMSIEM